MNHYFYSPSHNAFFHTSAHIAMPADAIEISDELHQSLSGRRTRAGHDGMPVLDDSVLIAPAPRVVTMRQARLALLEAGRLADVNHAIAALEGSAQAAALIEWEYAQTVERDSPFVAQLAAALELNDDALNDLFELAATL